MMAEQLPCSAGMTRVTGLFVVLEIITRDDPEHCLISTYGDDSVSHQKSACNAVEAPDRCCTV